MKPLYIALALSSLGCGGSTPATVPQRVDVVDVVAEEPRVVPRRITRTEGDEAPAATAPVPADRPSVPPPPVEPPAF